MTFLRKHVNLIIFLLLGCSYIGYSITVYTMGAGKFNKISDEKVMAGQLVWQQNNCQACHQIYGLGGYMGPDLTNIISEKNKGEEYAKLFIQSGSARMPYFRFDVRQMEELVAFLKHIDKTGKSIVRPENIDLFGNYSLAENIHE